MRRGLGAVNRFGLGIVGLILALAGGLGLLISTGLVRNLIMPVAVPQPAQPILPEPAWQWSGTQTGAVVIAIIAGAAALLVLGWLGLQLPRRRPNRPMHWASESPGVTNCAPATLGAAVEEQIEAIPGVVRAQARITGAAAAPIMEATVTVDEHSDVITVADRVTQQVCADLGTATGGKVHTCALRLDVGRSSGREARTIELAP